MIQYRFTATVYYRRHDGSTGSVIFSEKSEEGMHARAAHYIDYYTNDPETRYPFAWEDQCYEHCPHCEDGSLPLGPRQRKQLYPTRKPCPKCQGTGHARTIAPLPGGAMADRISIVRGEMR